MGVEMCEVEISWRRAESALGEVMRWRRVARIAVAVVSEPAILAWFLTQDSRSDGESILTFGGLFRLQLRLGLDRD